MSETFVWDATGLLHASKCDRLDLLLEAAGPARNHVAPEAVATELARKAHPLTSTGVVSARLDDLAEIVAVARWQQFLGSDPMAGHHVGEAEVMAHAEVRGAIAIVDDGLARRTARRNEPTIRVHGVLWAISRSVVEGRVPRPHAYSGLCDEMLRTGIRWPFAAGGFPAWFAQHEAKLRD